MFRQKLLLFVLCAVALALPLFAQDDAELKLKSTKGPANVTLKNVAEISVPAGCVFYDGDTTRRLMQAAGDQASGNEAGLIQPTNRAWSVFFEYNDSGHVMDDEKDKLDSMADKLLKSYKQGTAEQNKERERRGIPPIENLDWEQKPHYDEITHNLTWAIRGTIGGEPLLNYNTRLLGREGFMEVVLACDPNEMSQTFPAFTNLLAGYSFQSGQTYAEYRKGDKLAKYGLGALVLGGAGVAAAKLGLLAWLLPFLKKGWVLIVAAFAAIGNFFRKFLGRKSNDSGPTT